MMLEYSLKIDSFYLQTLYIISVECKLIFEKFLTINNYYLIVNYINSALIGNFFNDPFLHRNLNCDETGVYSPFGRWIRTIVHCFCVALWFPDSASSPALYIVPYWHSCWFSNLQALVAIVLLFKVVFKFFFFPSVSGFLFF